LKIFKQKAVNTVENIVHLQTFRPSTGAIINAEYYSNFQVTPLYPKQ